MASTEIKDIDALKEIQHLQNDFAEAEKQGNFSHEEINWIRSFAGKLDKIAEALKHPSGKEKIIDFDLYDMKWVNSDDDMKPFHTQKVWVWILLLTKPLAAEYNNGKFIGEDGELTGVFKWQPALIPFGPDVRMSMLQHTEYRKKFNRKPSWDNNRLLFESSPRITPDIEEWRNKEKEIFHKWQDHEYVELELMALLKKVLESFPAPKPKGSLQHEPLLGIDGEVMFVGGSDLVAHSAHAQCPKEAPHDMSECGLCALEPKGSMSVEELIFSQVRLLADVYKRSLPEQFLLDLDTLITSFPH